MCRGRALISHCLAKDNPGTSGEQVQSRHIDNHTIYVKVYNSLYKSKQLFVFFITPAAHIEVLRIAFVQ